MRNFEIVIEDQRTYLRSKIFEADTLEEAIFLAEQEEWTEEEGWLYYDETTNCELREELCKETDEKA